MGNKKRVIELLEQFDWMFGVKNFDRRLIWVEKEEGDKMAEIFFVEDYQQIDISLYPLFLTKSLNEQRKALLHEFCHIITLPSKQALHDLINGKFVTEERSREINETATSKIENLLDKLLQGQLTYAQEAYKKYSMMKKEVYKSKTAKMKHEKTESKKMKLKEKRKGMKS